MFLIGYKQSGRVTATDRWDAEGYVRVLVDTGGELDIKASSIKIHESVIEECWGNRLLHENSICTLLQAQGLNTSTTKPTAVNGTSTSKFLKRIGFVVTMKSQDDNNRTHIFDLIKNNGGKVVDDWANLFPFSPAQTDRGWVARRADVKHKELGVQTVFLLADEANQKPKYLVALALGIPCVSTNWLLDCCDQVSAFFAYALIHAHHTAHSTPSLAGPLTYSQPENTLTAACRRGSTFDGATNPSSFGRSTGTCMVRMPSYVKSQSCVSAWSFFHLGNLGTSNE